MIELNKRQQKILIIFSAYLIITMLFPPFYIGGNGGNSIGLGYGFLFKPPNDRGRVDVAQLLAQWLFGGLISVIAAYLSRKFEPIASTAVESRTIPAMKYGFMRSKWFLIFLAAYSIARAFAPNNDFGKQLAYGLLTFIGFLPIFIAMFAWYARKHYLGIQSDPPQSNNTFSWKRILMILGMLILIIGGYNNKYEELKPWDKNYSVPSKNIEEFLSEKNEGHDEFGGILQKDIPPAIQQSEKPTGNAFDDLIPKKKPLDPKAPGFHPD